MDLRSQLQSTLGDTYTIERELGGGGMSRVFVATERALVRKVVVKVLPGETAAQVSLERFKREILLAAKLQHPHIVPLLSAGESEGLPYFTMPFVEGESLRAHLTRRGEFPVSDAVRILREIAAALSYAHQHGIVHRDIKPDNVLLSGGSAMVTDFGVAKALSASSNAEQGGMTSLGVALGTPAYMAPEQATADPAIDHRADLYAFGVLAYELLTGQPPFVGRTPQNLLAAHVTEAPEAIGKRRATLPPALAALVMRCLEKRPADRPQSAAEVVQALDAITTPSGGTQPTGAVPSIAATGATGVSRPGSRLLAGISAIAVITLVAWLATRRGPAASRPETGSDARSMIVLPFVDESGDKSKEYVGEGIADELTSALGKLPGVTVKARSSVAAFKGSSLTPRQVGESLHVASVLTGRIRHAGAQARITAELVDVATGNTRWTSSYPAEFKDLFAAEESIARAIAGELRVTLATGTQLATAATVNAQAHDLYLQARFIATKYTAADLQRARTLLEQAIALDSNFSEAWGALAGVWTTMADDFMAATEAYPKARDAALRALAIKPGSAEALGALASELFWGEWKPDSAYRVASRARAIDPNNPEAWAALYWVHRHQGQRDSAAVAVRAIEHLTPMDSWPFGMECKGLLRDGNVPAAQQVCEKAIAINAHHSRSLEAYANVMVARQMYDSALRVIGAGAMMPRLARARVFAASGRRAEMQRELQVAEAEARGKYQRAMEFLRAYGVLDDAGAVVRWGEKALLQRDGGFLLDDLTDGWPDSVKEDPRVRAFLKRVDSVRIAAEPPRR